MIKKYLFIFMMVFFSAVCFSQQEKVEKPNYKKIEKIISDKTSQYHYPLLLKKYKSADTTMTLKEKRYLYYGFSFQDSYSPYGFSKFNDSLRVIFEKEQYTNNDLDKIVTFTDSILTATPFNLRALNHQLYALDKLKYEFDFNKRLIQYKIIVNALLSSGDGLTKETAFYVIYASHEYDLLKILGFQFGGQQQLIEHYDYLTVVSNSEKIEGFYFDVSPSLNSLNNMFK